MDMLLASYDWIKALHIMAVISWMAGLFYLPRLFVHHVERAKGKPEMEETFVMMEDKLYRVIMNPAMMVTWGAGLAMALIGGASIYASAWFGIKFLAVLAMTGFHIWCKKAKTQLSAKNYRHSGRHYRMMNEVPTLLMIIIVIMVVIKPFS